MSQDSRWTDNNLCNSSRLVCLCVGYQLGNLTHTALGLAGLHNCLWSRSPMIKSRKSVDGKVMHICNTSGINTSYCLVECFAAGALGPSFFAVGIQQSLLGQDCLWRSGRDHQAIMMDHELVTIKIICLLPASALAVLGTMAAMVF